MTTTIPVDSDQARRLLQDDGGGSDTAHELPSELIRHCADSLCSSRNQASRHHHHPRLVMWVVQMMIWANLT